MWWFTTKPSVQKVLAKAARQLQGRGFERSAREKGVAESSTSLVLVRKIRANGVDEIVSLTVNSDGLTGASCAVIEGRISKQGAGPTSLGRVSLESSEVTDKSVREAIRTFFPPVTQLPQATQA